MVMIYLNLVSMNNIGMKVQGSECTLVIIFRKVEKHDLSYVENYTHTHTHDNLGLAQESLKDA